MAAMTAQVVRSDEGTSFTEGAEFCRRYLRTDKIMFGTSTLQPGATGDVDPGHSASQEVFFVVRGHVLVLGADETRYELRQGDAILIPEGMPHTIANVGDDEAMITWSCAPSP